MKKIFRKKFFAFFLSALLVLALSLPVFADMGPKPSVTLKLYYTPGQRYAVTLLGNTALNGPWTAPADYRERMGSREAWEAFRNYPAPEGYYFLGYFQEYPGDADAEFVWGYYPPNKFYVLLYNIETGTFYRSQEPVERPCCIETTAMGAAYLAGLAVGYWPDQETVKQNGAIDRTFEPELSKEERDEKMNGWHKAVSYAEGWAK